ncbi:carbamoyltransferase C-terminal domain-containing protein [Streptomyces sp. NPDC049597]|uniref:carbamoyltransferase C-terminal domain-containing protein n=1 Tax=Streptomyces sp. NPDC049597 TaxID=3155276 RepID=UPI00342E30F6
MTAEVILGVCAHTHDSSAALFVGGSLIGFLEEDRLVDDKHTRAFPSEAARLLLAAAGRGPDEVTAVAYTFDSSLYRHGRERAMRRAGDPARRRRAVHSYDSIAAAHAQTLRRLTAEFPCAAIVEVPHHRAHAFSAIAPQGWHDRDVLVVDSIGEAATTSMGGWNRAARSLDLRALTFDTDSLGYVYGALTDHLGFRMRDEEGTVMALAAYGDPSRFRALLARAIPLTPRGFRVSTRLVRQRVFGDSGNRLTDAFVLASIPRRAPGEELTQDHADLAASLQERVEEVTAHLVGLRPGSGRSWAVAGGVATNCVAVGKLRDLPNVAELFVPPAPGDSGTSLGAAVAVVLEKQCLLAEVPASPYWGVEPAIPKAEEVRNRGFEVSGPHEERDLARRVAAALAKNDILGIYRGAAEAGPRALGHRSIIANPLSPQVHDRLATRVKKRETFRPFAPMVLADRAAGYFDLRGCESPYMSLAVDARQELLHHAPTVIHRNGTARVQTVKAGTDAFLEALLGRYEQLTGSPLLINTSLNMKGRPTAGSWQAALSCLTEMCLDGLVLGDLFVTSRGKGLPPTGDEPGSPWGLSRAEGGSQFHEG